MKKSKLVLFFIPLLLCGCGLDSQQCKDNIATFPLENSNPKFNLKSEQNFSLNETNLYTSYPTYFNSLSEGEQKKEENKNIINFAAATSLKKTSSINSNIRYPQLFDGVIACSGANPNSRLGLYSEGIIIEFPKLATSVNSICLYMAHNVLQLKMRATVTLYRTTGNPQNSHEYDAYNFVFDTVLGTSAAGPKFYYVDALKAIDDKDKLTNIKMIGFRFERLTLTEDEKKTGYYTPYIASLEEEKDPNREKKSFIKMYDMSLPHSTWSK